jgi:GNAT superfamily N-acetyltransferase
MRKEPQNPLDFTLGLSKMIAVRPSTTDDAAAMQAIYSLCITSAIWLPESAKQSPVFEENSVGEIVHVAAKEDGQVIGFVSVQAGNSFVHHLYVHPDAHGNGVGQRLLSSLESWLPRPWQLKCVRRNIEAFGFYTRIGWYEVGAGESEHGPFAVLAYDPRHPIIPRDAPR